MRDQVLRKQLILILPRLRRYALSLTRDVTDADELVQDACLRALSRSNQWDEDRALIGWMLRIVHNTWISETRKRQVRTGHGNIPAEEASELLTQITGENYAIASDIQQAIAALPATLSTTLLLVTVEGYTYKEAADFLNVPVGTVMSRISRARARLIKQIDPLLKHSSAAE